MLSLLGKGCGPSFLLAWIFFTKGCFVLFRWNCPGNSWGKKRNVFSLLSPLRKGPHLNKLDSPSLEDALHPVSLKSNGWFWKKRFFNVLQNFHSRHLLSASPTMVLIIIRDGIIMVIITSKMGLYVRPNTNRNFSNLHDTTCICFKILKLHSYN